MKNTNIDDEELRALAIQAAATRDAIVYALAREAMAARKSIKRLREALVRLRDGTDAPDLRHKDMVKGLACGLEDRDIYDRYDAAEYGWDDAAERFAEWATNEAQSALDDAAKETE